MDRILADRIRDKNLDQRLSLNGGPAAPAPGGPTKNDKKTKAKAKAAAAAKAAAKAEKQRQQDQKNQPPSRPPAAPATKSDKPCVFHFSPKLTCQRGKDCAFSHANAPKADELQRLEETVAARAISASPAPSKGNGK